MFGNIPDLTSPTGTEPQLPGGVAVGSVVQVPGNGLVGKSSVVIVLEREGEGLATSESSQTSASCCELVWLEESLGITVCGSKIGSKQGMQRFCISSVVGETTLCGISTHSKSAKAKAEPLAWYITSAIRGRHGGRAALVDKPVRKTDVDPDFYTEFNEGSMEAEEWEILFIGARMGKQIRSLQNGFSHHQRTTQD
jgi:hypothetical protein